MDDQENYDPGIVNTIVDAFRDRKHGGDPDEESMIDRARGSVSDISMGGQADARDEAVHVTPDIGATGHGQEHEGSIEEIAGDNTAVRHAAQDLDDESLARGPAHTDPDVASGAFGT
jgi:hypothetical protein